MLLRFFRWLDTHSMANMAALNMCLATFAAAQTQDDQCWQQRQQALVRFRANDYAGTIVLLNRCLNQAGLNDSAKVDIYALLSRAHLAIPDSVAATRDILNLLDLAPRFVPNAVDYTPGYRKFFVAVIEAVKKVRESRPPAGPQSPAEQPNNQVKTPKRPRSKKWLWIGGGGAVATAGIVYAIIPRKKNEGKVFLPDPPGRPQ